MPLSLAFSNAPAGTRGELGKSWPAAAGLLVLYVPTYFTLVTNTWRDPEKFHGALFFALALWMLWTKRRALVHPSATPSVAWGASFLLIGCALYVIGRSQDALTLEALSQVFVLTGTVLVLRGWPALRQLWFPIVFLLFVVPLPGSLLDGVLLPLKQLVSSVVDHLLFALGYPIARNGVVLSIGPYQVLIADACAGLKSAIALSGVGLAYVYLMQRAKWQNAVLAASVLPIAFLANVLRVTCLTLATFHFGDDVGQRFHDIAGAAEVAFALAGFFAIDALLSFGAAAQAARSRR
jgi:exosortase B